MNTLYIEHFFDKIIQKYIIYKLQYEKTGEKTTPEAHSKVNQTNIQDRDFS